MTAPTLSELTGEIAVAENDVNAVPRLIDGDVIFDDPDGNLAGGTLTVSGLLGEDRIGLTHEGMFPGQIGVLGNQLYYGGNLIGAVGGGTGSTFTVNFFGAVTSEAVDALIENLTYFNLSNAPTDSRTLFLNVTDSAGNGLGPAAVLAEFTELTGGSNPLAPVAGAAVGLAFHDFDGDDDLDALVLPFSGPSVALINAGGAYSFAGPGGNPFEGLVSGPFARPIFADFDGDGDDDLVVGQSDGTLRALRNSGGVFAELAGVDNPFTAIDVGDNCTPAFTDLDGDMDLDLVVGSASGQLRSWENDGGSFVELIGIDNPFAAIVFGPSIASPAFADLDGDGDDDLVVAAQGAVHAFRNSGGGFVYMHGDENPFVGLSVTTGAAPAFADFNRDGRLDAFLAGVPGVRAFRNIVPEGAAIVVEVTPEHEHVLNGLATSVAFAENAANAAPQLIDADVTFQLTAPATHLTVSGLLSEDRVGIRHEGMDPGNIGVSGSQIFYGGTLIAFFSGGTGSTLTVNFFSGVSSAAIDALIENLTYSNLSNAPTHSRTLILDVTDASGNGLGPAALPAEFVELTGGGNPLAAFGSSPVGLAFHDFDGDGDSDALVVTPSGFTTLLLNQDGLFTSLPSVANPFASVQFQPNARPIFADFDGDGDDDLVVGSGTALRAFRNVNGAFTELTGGANPFPTDLASLPTPAFTDFDGDDDLDLVLGSTAGQMRGWRNDGGIFVELGVSDNPFAAIAGPNFASPAFADLDGDGDDDLVVTALGAVQVFRNVGHGYAPLPGSANPFAGLSMAVGMAPVFTDLDGDGRLDAFFAGLSGIRTFRNLAADGAAIVVNVTPEHEHVLTGLTASVAFAENAANAAPQLIDADVTFQLTTPATHLTVSGLLAEDVVRIRHQGMDPGNIGISGSQISYGGSPIGFFNGGVGSTLTVTLFGGVPSAAIDALIQNLTYSNTSNSPTHGRILVIDVTDASGNGLGPAAMPAEYIELTGGAHPLTQVAGTPAGLGFHDFDGDGDLDALALTNFATTILLLNQGGIFTSVSSIANPFAPFQFLSNSRPTFADLDGDGDDDLAVGGTDGQLRVFANADGHFTELAGASNPFAAIDVGNNAVPVFTDLDGDDDLDLVVGGSTGQLRSWRNDGGSFVELAASDNPLAAIAFGPGTVSPAFADLDGDGDDDLLVAAQGSVHAFRNVGSGFLYMPGEANPFAGLSLPAGNAPVIADLDGDGKLDAVFAGPSGVRVFRNIAPDGAAIDVSVTPEGDAPTLTGLTSSIHFDVHISNPVPQLIDADVAFADPNGDLFGGALTISGLLLGDRIGVRHQGDGPGEIAFSGGQVRFGGIPVGFVTGVPDGFRIQFTSASSAAVDALIQNLTYTSVSASPAASRTLLLNVTDSTGADVGPLAILPSYSPMPAGSHPFASLTGSRALSFGDLDQDGDLDAVTVRFAGLAVLRNDGGNFTEITGMANPFSQVSGNRLTPFLVDLDGDLDLDLVVGNLEGTLRALRNDHGLFTELIGGDNPFGAIDLINASAPAFFDVDGDGDLDLVVGSDLVRTYINQSGTFVALTVDDPFAAVSGGVGLTPSFTDLDRDGDLDLVVGDQFGAVRTYRNDGGTFAAMTGIDNPFDGFVAPSSNSAPAFLDVDGDGDLDAVIGHSSGVSVLRNDVTHGRTIAISVTAVPNIAPAATDATLTLLEDGSHVLTLADFGFSDADDNGFAAILIGTIPDAGTLLYDADGASGDPPVAVVDGHIIPAAHIALGRLSFVPPADANGASFASFTFRVQDDGGTVAGGQDIDLSPNRITFDVTAVNDAPTGASDTVVIDEDIAHVFGTADFGFSDPVDGDELYAVLFEAPPTGGRLLLDADGVGGNDPVELDYPATVSATDIGLGRLAFVPDEHLNGAGAASVVFRVIDDGAGTPPDVNIAAAANILTFDVTAVNDKPVNTLPANISGTEDVALNITGLSVSDVDDNGADILVGLSVANGVLTIRTDVSGGVTASHVTGNGSSMVAMVASRDEINATLAEMDGVIFSGANVSGNVTMSMTANDLGRTGIGGAQGDVDLSTLRLAPVADTPSVTHATTDEDTMSSSGLVISRNAVDGAEVSHFKITGITNGTLYLLDGVTVVNDGDFISFADANAGLKFDPDPEFFGNGSFGVQASLSNSDAGLGGAVVTATVTVNSINDAPVVPDQTDVAANEQTAVTLFPAITISDVDLDEFNGGLGDYAGATFAIGQVVASPDDFFSFDTTGALFTVNGSDLEASGQVFATFVQSGGAAGVSFTSLETEATTALVNDVLRHLQYTHLSDTPPVAVTLIYGIDDGPTGGGQGIVVGGNNVAGQDIVVTITAFNDLPSGSNLTVSTLEDHFRALDPADFGFNDVDGTFARVTITTVTNGSIFWDADGAGAGGFAQVTLPQSFSHFDLAGGFVRFVPATNINGSGTVSFIVVDDLGGSDPVANVLTVNIGTVNDAPDLSAVAPVTSIEQTPTAVLAGVTVSDVDLDARNGGLGDYEGAEFSLHRNPSPDAEDLFSLVAGAGFTIDGDRLEAGGLAFATFTVSPIGSILIEFTSSETPATGALVNAVIQSIHYANGSDTPPASVDLAFSFTDGSPGGGQGTGATGLDVELVTVNITAVNDVPVNGLTPTEAGTEDTSLVFSVAGDNAIIVSDADATNLEVTVSVAHGVLTLADTTDLVFTAGNGTGDATMSFSGTAAAINHALDGLVYAPEADHAGGDSLTITTDDGSEEDSDSVVIALAPVNDAPLLGNLEDNSGSFTEDGAPVLLDAGSDAAVSDIDSPDFGGGSLTVSVVAGGIAAEDLLGIDTGGNVTITGTIVSVGATAIGTITSDGSNGNDLVIAFNADATFLLIQELVRALTYANADFIDPDTTPRSIEIVLVDGDGVANAGVDSVLVTVGVTITATEELPVAADDAVTTPENRIATGSLFGNDQDLDGPALAVAAVNGAAGNVGATLTLASGARLTVQANGDFVYNPRGRFDHLVSPNAGVGDRSATDSFTYTLANGNTATVTVTIDGIDGNDLLIGTPGIDTMFGGSGKDTMMGRAANDHMDGGTGNDQILGEGGDDELNGGAGRDSLDGGKDDDTLNGGDDADLLNGGKGADTMAGGADNDGYRVDNVGDLVIELPGGGKDGVLSTISYTLPDQVELLRLLGGGDLSGRGNALDNEILGNSGDNYLSGNAGNDRIEGGSGDDTLIGGLGLDTLIGGAGMDTFLFNTNPAKPNTDRIYDYAVGEDRIVLDGDAFTGIAAGTLGANAFHAGTSAGDADDRILYDDATGKIFYDPDGSGAAAAILFAAVGAGTPLTHADFLIG